MKPVVDGLAREYEGRVEFRRYNVQSDPTGIELANQLGVDVVPTFVYVNSSGVQAGSAIGRLTADQIREQLDRLQ